MWRFLVQKSATYVSGEPALQSRGSKQQRRILWVAGAPSKWPRCRHKKVNNATMLYTIRPYARCQRRRGLKCLMDKVEDCDGSSLEDTLSFDIILPPCLNCSSGESTVDEGIRASAALTHL
eukprot:COSAG02_NODE_14156_length_1303_cov_9.059201_2_plen_121_part_00